MLKKYFEQNVERVSFYLLIYTFLICSQGIYLFGNDLIEILPFLKKIGHPELYVNDFYIQSAWSKPLFERSVFIYLLHFLHAEYVKTEVSISTHHYF